MMEARNLEISSPTKTTNAAVTTCKKNVIKKPIEKKVLMNVPSATSSNGIRTTNRLMTNINEGKNIQHENPS